MSTNIRQTLTTQLNRLEGYLNTCGVIIEAAGDGNPPGEAEQLTLRRNARLMGDLLAKIEAKQVEWEQLIARLIGQERNAEQNRFDSYAKAGMHFVEVIDLAQEMTGQIDVLLDEVARAASQSGRTRRPSSASRSSSGRGSDHNKGIRLPEYTLKKFSGNPRRWQAFWQNFEVAVHRRTNLNDCMKCSYLLGALEEAAEHAVSKYGPTAEDYPKVIGKLKERFGDPKIVRDALEAELINLSFAGESIKAMRKTAEDIERICGQFVQLGEDENGGMMLTTAKSKFPDDVLTELARDEYNWKLQKQLADPTRIDDVKWGMPEFRDGLKRFLTIREEVTRCVRSVKAPKKSQESNKKGNGNTNQRLNSRDKPNEARAFGASVSKSDKEQHTPNNRKGSQRKKIPPCPFDQKSHWAQDCDTIVDTDARRKMLIDQKRCLKCLRKGHVVADCRRNKGCRHCNGPHHACLCKQSMPTDKGNKNSNRATTAMSVVAFKSNSKEDHLMTRWLNLSTKEGETVPTLVFLDPGSQVSFVNKTVANNLRSTYLGPQALDLFTVGTTTPKKMKTHLFSFELPLQGGGTEEVQAYTTEDVSAHVTAVWAANSNVHAIERKPDILLGLRHFWHSFRGIEETSPGSFVIHTIFGDVLCGRWHIDAWHNSSHPIGRAAAYGVSIDNHNSMPVTDEVRDFWALEHIGIRDDPREDEDEAAMKSFQSTICRTQEGRYEVGWLWKDENPNLPSNYQMAYSRLLVVCRKLHSDPDKGLIKKYDDIIKEQFFNGIIEYAARNEGGLEHFLPHHAVITHKLRIVYDASAQARGAKSLNQLLYRGPVILPDLVGLLMRFRTPNYPVLADIEKAFLMLGLREQDREAAKFLWVKDTSKPVNAENLQIFRFTRVAFRVISSPFLLGATIRHHMNSYGTPLSQEMSGDTYVDNVLLRCKTAMEVQEKALTARKIFQEAQINLREFVSNAPKFHTSLTPELLLDTKIPKVLGIPWDLESDTISISFPQSNSANVHSSNRVAISSKRLRPVGSCLSVPASLQTFFSISMGD